MPQNCRIVTIFFGMNTRLGIKLANVGNQWYDIRTTCNREKKALLCLVDIRLSLGGDCILKFASLGTVKLKLG